MGWRDWLDLKQVDAGHDGSRTEVVERISRALDGLPPERARYVAAFAYHLGRVAHADHQLTEAERHAIRRTIARESGLPPEQVDVASEMVLHESLVFRGTEDYRVTREFNHVASYDEKLALVRCLFGISAADQSVVVHEDNEIRRIALALKVSDADFVAARVSVREHLAVLRRSPLPS